MRLLLTTLLLLPAIATAQQLYTFKNGEVADAEKLNESLQYILNNASGGCSATQQDNSVLIECADGTSGVLAGAGTVIIYPEGEVGEVPPVDFNTGPIVLKDGNDVLLGESAGSNAMDMPQVKLTSEAQPTAVLWNHGDGVALTGSYRQNTYYLETGCTGAPFLHFGDSLVALASNYFVPVVSEGTYTLLFESRRNAAMLTDSELIEASACIDEQYPATAFRSTTYTPAPEILNAAYPIRLEQLP